MANHLKCNGGAGYRSPYLSHAKRALYHLSYTPWCLGGSWKDNINRSFSKGVVSTLVKDEIIMSLSISALPSAFYISSLSSYFILPLFPSLITSVLSFSREKTFAKAITFSRNSKLWRTLKNKFKWAETNDLEGQILQKSSMLRH